MARTPLYFSFPVCDLARCGFRSLVYPFVWTGTHAGLRGGTPYAQLPDGSGLLAAMHVKDTEHTPALYATVLYLLDSAPPFRVRSLSPKLCFSERDLELASSARCALQYVVGLSIDERAGLVLFSFGDFDRRMRIASLPLKAAVEFARTHVIDAHGGETECAAAAVAWHVIYHRGAESRRPIGDGTL